MPQTSGKRSEEKLFISNTACKWQQQQQQKMGRTSNNGSELNALKLNQCVYIHAFGVVYTHEQHSQEVNDDNGRFFVVVGESVCSISSRTILLAHKNRKLKRDYDVWCACMQCKATVNKINVDEKEKKAPPPPYILIHIISPHTGINLKPVS